MWTGVQFTGTLGPSETKRWFTFNWPAQWHVVWYVVPTAPVQDRAAQIEWKVQVERQTASLLKYYIEITNLTGLTVTAEARFTVLGWTRATR